MLPSLLIIDDFIADPMAARNAALALNYDPASKHGNYPGHNSTTALDIQGLDERVSKIINVPVKTRIGSKFSNDHDIEYISLRQGEIVELLGSRMLAESRNDNPVRWFKIAPPSGEFRWVHSRQLKRTKNDPIDLSLRKALNTGFRAIGYCTKYQTITYAS